MKNLAITTILMVLTVVACKEPFSPEVEAKFKNLLVVEGYLNIGGASNFTLSRTAELRDFQARIPEQGAKIEVQDSQGTLIQAITGENGQCSLATQDLDLSKNYRVKITTKNGGIYQTDYLESKATPPIDSVSRSLENNGFKLYVNTHDSSNKARFYSWNFQETWEIRSTSISYWELKAGKIVPRDPNINITRCWQENTSSGIILSSTERLSEDRVSQFPLTYVPGNSIRLRYLYSLLVKQFGLTKEAYQYVETMKKNTESIGTIFDPQPSELRGNIRCVTSPDEVVIGWISAGNVSEKRIFIKASDKPANWGYDDYCGPVREMHTDTVRKYLIENLILYRDIWVVPQVPKPWKLGDTSYAVAPARCVDCRLRGSNIKPLYWPD